MLKKIFEVVYHDEFGNKEIINTFFNYADAEECYRKCMEGDRSAQINHSYDIEEGVIGSPGH